MSFHESLGCFFKKWKLAPTEFLFTEFKLESRATLLSSLRRLRDQNEILSIRLRKEWIHFDRSLKLRASALEKLPFLDRVKKFQTWGLDHDLYIVSRGRSLERYFSSFDVHPNFFKPHISFSLGSENAFCKKVIPDLVLTPKEKVGSCQGFIEIERSLKAKNRYWNIWLTYESDRSVALVLYWVFDKALMNTIERYMLEYQRGSDKKSKFILALINDADYLASEALAPVSIFTSKGSQKSSLAELLASLSIEEGIKERA